MRSAARTGLKTKIHPPRTGGSLEFLRIVVCGFGFKYGFYLDVLKEDKTLFL